MASRITIKLEGFDELLSQIQKAGGAIDSTTEQLVRQSANTMRDELKAQMQAAGVDGDLISGMPQPYMGKQGNRYFAEVGWHKGDYDPANLSDGYKVVFLNYGTPRRTKHGKIAARGFIQKAKKKARPKIKKQQQETLSKILGRLRK